jgi:hypothetical protein
MKYAPFKFTEAERAKVFLIIQEWERRKEGTRKSGMTTTNKRKSYREANKKVLEQIEAAIEVDLEEELS